MEIQKDEVGSEVNLFNFIILWLWIFFLSRAIITIIKVTPSDPVYGVFLEAAVPHLVCANGKMKAKKKHSE